MADRNATNCSAIARQETAMAPQREGGVNEASMSEAHTKAGAVTYRPPMDLFDCGDRYELRLDLPGTTSERIAVTVNDGLLTIEATVPSRYPEFAADEGASPQLLLGEFGIGDFRRQIRLGEDIDVERLAATYEHGVLRLTLPKRAERQPRRIVVKTA